MKNQEIQIKYNLNETDFEDFVIYIRYSLALTDFESINEIQEPILDKIFNDWIIKQQSNYK